MRYYQFFFLRFYNSNCGKYNKIVGVLSNICKKEKISLPNSLAQTIAQQSERNLRKAILMLEATKVKK